MNAFLNNLKSNWLNSLLVGAVLLAAVGCLLVSLTWRMCLDVPIMLTLGNLVAHGAVPYRDFFDMNLPGSYWFFAFLTSVFGTSDFAVYFAHALLTLAVAALTFGLFRPAGLYPALLAAGLGALRIYSATWGFILQREFLALIPILALLLLAFRFPRLTPGRACLTGLCLALLLLIKPQLVLYGLPAYALMMDACPTWRERVTSSLLIAATAALPLTATVWWLVHAGAIASFHEVIRYWALYGQLNFEHVCLAPSERPAYFVREISRLVFSPYTICAIAGLVAAAFSKALTKKQLATWGMFLVLCMAIPAISGQFFGYHRLPFFFFSVALAGYLLTDSRCGQLVALAIAALWIGFAGIHVTRETRHSAVQTQHAGIPDAIGAYLKLHAASGDTAQPLDWARGALHGMLIAHVQLATRYPYTFYFYHHVSHPLIRHLRADFLNQLEKTQPRFLVEATQAQTPTGFDTATHFPAFEAWRQQHYRLAAEGPAYRIWERISD